MPTVAEVVRRYGPAYLERFGDRDARGAPARCCAHIAACRTGELGTVALPLRGLRQDARRRPIVRRPALPELPARQGRGLARRSRPIACCRAPISWSPSPCRRSCGRSRAAISGRSTRRCSGPRARRCAPWRPIPKYHRHRSTGVLRRPAHLGPDAGVSSPCPLRGPRRRARAPTATAGWRRAPTSWCRSKALSIVFRAKFRDLLAGEGLLEQVDPSVWRRDWVVHCQPAGDGRESLRYLAPYVFRVAIGDHRIVSCDDGRVTFTYRKVGSKRQRKMTLDAMEFLRRFLQHVLPSGLPKVRHYGFLSPASGAGRWSWCGG